MKFFIFVVMSVFLVSVMSACENLEDKKVTVEKKEISPEKKESGKLKVVKPEKLKAMDLKKIKKIEDPSKKRLDSFKKNLKENQNNQKK